MRTFLAIMLLVVLIPTVFVVALVTSIQTNLLQASFFKGILAHERVYDLAFQEADRRILAFSLADNPIVTGADVQTLVPKIIAKPWLQMTVEGVLDQFFAWLRDPSDQPLRLLVDLRDPKERIVREAEPLFVAKLAAIPVCTTRESKEGALCRPAALTLDAYRQQLLHAGFDIPGLVKQLSDTVDVAQPEKIQLFATAGLPGQQPASSSPEEQTPPGPSSAKGQNNFSIERMKQGYQMLPRIIGYAWLAVAVLVLLYFLLILRGLRRTVRWVGVLFVCVGVLPLATALASRPVLNRLIEPNLRLTGDAAQFAPTVFDAIEYARGTLFGPLLVGGLALVVLGTADIVVSFFLPHAKKIFRPKMVGKGVNLAKPAFSK